MIVLPKAAPSLNSKLGMTLSHLLSDQFGMTLSENQLKN